jgi:hypothetical protein
LAVTLSACSPINPLRSCRRKLSQSIAVSPAYKLSLCSELPTGSVNTASPAESGPRSVMPISIGTINSPSRGRSAAFFSNNPTIPHMAARF